jgi:hypothetical protein
MTSPRPAATRGEGQGEGWRLIEPPLPGPLLHKCVEERELSEVVQIVRCAAGRRRLQSRLDSLRAWQ